MDSRVITHHATCNADYPEKPEGELPQEIVEIKLDDEVVFQCSDCGAFETVTHSRRT